MIDLMLGLRAAELEDFAARLASWPTGDIQRLANRRPDLWVARVAELYTIVALARRLPELALVGLPLRPVRVRANRQAVAGIPVPQRSVDVPQPASPTETPVVTG